MSEQIKLKRPKNSVLISEIFHLAADKYLNTESCYDEGKNGFSCLALEDANFEIFDFYSRVGRVMEYIELVLRHLGLDTSSMREFNEFESGIIRQGARYNWLKFVALLAEEQEAEQRKLGIRYWVLDRS